MIGSKWFPNVVTLVAVGWWSTISWGPALADQVVLMNTRVVDGGNGLNEVEQEFGGNHDPGFVVRNSDLEMGYERVEGYYDDDEGSTPTRMALRYEGIAIPPGATITGAHIQFMADDEPDKTTFNPPFDPELGTGTFAPLEASFSIYGYLNPVTPANAPPLPPSTTNPNSLAQKYLLTDLTGGQCANPLGNCAGGTGPKGGVGSEIINVTAPVHWIDIPTWSTGDVDNDGVAEPELGEYGHIGGTAGPDQRTPDLKSIIQHIVDLPGWASGNAMTFFIDPMVEVAGTVPGVDDDTFFRGNRTAVSTRCHPNFNRCLDVPNPTPPVLTIDFTTDAAPDGDHNEDGTADAADYVAWRKSPDSFGGDPAGYNVWRQHFAEGGPGASPSGAVPEPGCYALVVSIVVASLLARTRSVH